jgi:cysteine synthase
MKDIKSEKSVLGQIGDTEIIDLSNFSPNSNVIIYAKFERSNPSGSIKDRVAIKMIEKAEKDGLLKPGMSIVEPTSGNTGIALAMVSAIKGYKFSAVMPASVSTERASMIRSFGGQVVRVEGNDETGYSLDQMYKAARRIQRRKNGIILDQFKNPANITAHRYATAKEIIEQIPEVTHFVAGIGTGGTLSGVSLGLKDYKGSVKSFGLEPKLRSDIQGLHNTKDYYPPILEKGVFEGILFIDEEEALRLMRKLNKAGISAGPSSGANLWGAAEIARKINEGVIVTILPDGMEKYLSTGMLDDKNSGEI